MLTSGCPGTGPGRRRGCRPTASTAGFHSSSRRWARRPGAQNPAGAALADPRAAAVDPPPATRRSRRPPDRAELATSSTKAATSESAAASAPPIGLNRKLRPSIRTRLSTTDPGLQARHQNLIMPLACLPFSFSDKEPYTAHRNHHQQHQQRYPEQDRPAGRRPRAETSEWAEPGQPSTP